MEKKNGQYISNQQLISNYQSDLKVRNKSPKTITWYSEILHAYDLFLNTNCGVTSFFNAAAKELKEYIAYLQEAKPWPNRNLAQRKSEHLSAHTIQGHVRAIRAFWGWLHTEELIAANPLAKFKLPKVPTLIMHTLSQKQLMQLLEAIYKDSSNSLRDRLILMTFIDTGLRISELVKIKIKDIDFAQQFIVTCGKGDKQRSVPFTSTLRKALLKYVKENLNYPDKESFLFEGADKSSLSVSCVQQMLRRLAKRAGLEGVKCSPHVFRHTFATMAIASGMNVFALKEILGHSSLTTTLRYVHLQPGDLKAEHDKHSPLVELMKK